MMLLLPHFSLTLHLEEWENPSILLKRVGQSIQVEHKCKELTMPLPHLEMFPKLHLQGLKE